MAAKGKDFSAMNTGKASTAGGNAGLLCRGIFIQGLLHCCCLSNRYTVSNLH